VRQSLATNRSQQPTGRRFHPAALDLSQEATTHREGRAEAVTVGTEGSFGTYPRIAVLPPRRAATMDPGKTFKQKENPRLQAHWLSVMFFS